MAFLAHDSQLVISGITRNQIHETPGGTVERANLLPEWCKSGAAGCSAEGMINLAPETWQGIVGYTAP